MARIEMRYFAFMRERIGVSSEFVETNAASVRDLIAELVALDEAHAVGLSDLAAVRVALDQDLADLDAPLEGVQEVALFPPMTGG